MKRIMILLLILVGLVGLVGCANRTAGSSFVGKPPKDAALQIIAADAAVCLANLYPPGRTTLHLAVPKSEPSGFGQALETSLRGKGFTLDPATTPTLSASVQVAYVLDELEPGKAWYLNLKIAEATGSRAFSRVYTAEGRPEAGFSTLEASK
jgi:hypothetical protein